MATKVQKIMTQPINLMFRFLQSKQRIQVWLFDQADLRLEGRLIGFDEYMNLVLDEAEEVSVKRKTRKTLGRILLKGDNITLLQVWCQRQRWRWLCAATGCRSVQGKGGRGLQQACLLSACCRDL